jgi:hypothetical protein
MRNKSFISTNQSPLKCNAYEGTIEKQKKPASAATPAGQSKKSTQFNS